MFDILSKLYGTEAVDDEFKRQFNPTPHGPVRYRSRVDSPGRAARRARVAEIKRNRRKQTKQVWRRHREQRFEGLLARGRAVVEAR